MKLKILLIVFFLSFSLVHASNYGSGTYGSGIYEGTISKEVSTVTIPSTASGGARGGSSRDLSALECIQSSDCGFGRYCFENSCHSGECLENSECNVGEGETCWEFRCVKLFDIKILDFESPLKLGDFFNFEYFLKGVADINGDVQLDFWIENDKEVVTYGSDTVYMGSYEDKIEKTKLFLPSSVASGVYQFMIKLRYGTYEVSSSRTIEVEVEAGIAKIIPVSIYGEYYQKYKAHVLGGIILFLLAFVLGRKSLTTRRIRNHSKYKKRIRKRLNRIMK
jgi:hypothetical protein